jgi:F-type H+-transporting ATPase subunit a
MRFLAEGPPGTHDLTPVCGNGSDYLNLIVIKFYYCAISLDTIASSALAIVVTLAIAFWVANHLRNGVPGKLQMVLEFLVSYTRGLVRETVAEDANFVIPLAATIGLYILVANWLDLLPLPKPYFFPANADLNQTLAMATVVFILVQGYSIKVLGIGGYFRRFTKPFEMALPVRIAFIPLNVIEELVKPVTLSLRLFGNIFAGLLMVYLLTLIPFYVAWIPVVLWKFFDVFFVGTIQAFIFMLLTIIYFGMAREGLEDEEKHPASTAATTGHAQGARTPATPH